MSAVKGINSKVVMNVFFKAGQLVHLHWLVGVFPEQHMFNTHDGLRVFFLHLYWEQQYAVVQRLDLDLRY